METPDPAFAVEPVPKGLGPGWCWGLAIEYTDEWGGVPEEGIRSTANAVSFVMGRPLIGVGRAAFDEDGRALGEVAVSPLQKDLVSVCRAVGHPPVDLDEKRPSDRFEALMAGLVPRCLDLNGEFDFDKGTLGLLALRADASRGQPARARDGRGGAEEGLVLVRALEVPRRLHAEELAAIDEKLRKVEYGDRMARRIGVASNLVSNESMEFFFEELGLPIGSVERSAIKARNLMAHGSEAVLDEFRHQETINDTLSYRTLFNRIVLDILGATTARASTTPPRNGQRGHSMSASPAVYSSQKVLFRIPASSHPSRTSYAGQGAERGVAGTTLERRMP